MADAKKSTGFIARVTRLVEWFMNLKPMRVWFFYLDRRGPLLASGLSYVSLFAVFAGIWVAFSTFGLILDADEELRDALFDFIAANIPGLIDTGEGGAIDPDALVDPAVLTWTGVIALGALLFTAIGWFASARDSVRLVAQLPPPRTFWVLLILKDLGLAIAFGAAVLFSAALSVLGTTFVETVLDWLEVDDRSWIATGAGRGVAILLMFVFDTIVLAMLYRVLAGVRIPLRQLLPGALLGAAVLGILKLLGNTLLGGASNNPLLASFATIIGLLIWFNLVGQVILIAAAWIVMGMKDAGIPLDEVAEKERREREAEERARIKAEVRSELEAERPTGFFDRLFGRRRRKKESVGSK